MLDESKMPNRATIEDAPHHLKVLYDYSKTAVTLSLGLLTLSVAFADTLLKAPADLFQASLLVALWLFLIVALIGGLYISAHVTGASYDYLSALRKAYPDDLQVISKGHIVQDPREVKLDAKEREGIAKGLTASAYRVKAAYRWATISFFMFAFAAVAVAVLGYYSVVYRTHRVTASASVDRAMRFAAEKFKVGKDARLSSVTYQEKDRAYEVVIRDPLAPVEEYQVKVDAATGEVMKASKGGCAISP